MSNVSNAHQPRSLWVIGHRITPIRVGERIVAIDGITPPGVPGPPPHRHEDSAELFYVLSGRVGIMIEGEWTSYGAGEQAEVPRGALHTFRNEGDGDLRLLNAFEVPGFEKWFEEVGYDSAEPEAQERSVSDEAIAHVIEVSPRFHMIIAAPAGAGVC